MYLNSELCDICGTCVSVCPADAIIVSEFKVIIKKEICTKCKACIVVCPLKAIYQEASSEAL